jgi:poly-gamma-glutamate synthesis protein (capsule biosynthesis protein)
MDASSGKALLEGLSPQCDQLEITDDGIGKLKFNLTEGD